MSTNASTEKYEEQICFQLRDLYRRYGYTQYRMSKFEEYELYARNKSFLVSDHILTFTDTDGKLLALKPDVTLSIIKNSPGSGAIQKVYYNENVYRAVPPFGYREIMQAGLECIGDLDDYAVCEVILLASLSLQTISNQYLLDISHIGIVSGLLDYIGLDGRSDILEYIAAKNTAGVRSLCREQNISEKNAELLYTLIDLYGTPAQVLPVLERITVNQQMSDALEKLRLLCDFLKPVQDNLRLDFSIVNDMNYYSGIIFRGYLPGLASGVLAGGEYDNLLQRMGKSGQAIGFAVYMDQLSGYSTPQKEFDVDILLLYGKGTDLQKVSATADVLRRDGAIVRVERTIPAGLRYRECREVI